MHFYDQIIQWYMDNINYSTITILMLIESTAIPFPSEVVIPPAVYKALSTGEMNVVLIVLFGTLGAVLGALINYFIARYVGRKLVYRFANSHLGHFCLLNQHKVEQAEKYFVKNGNSSTFIGRLLPGIRQLISVPAGLARMSLGKFTLYTTLGAGIWNIALAALGWLAHGQKDRLDQYYHELTLGMVVLGVLFISYLLYNGIKKNGKKAEN